MEMKVLKTIFIILIIVLMLTNNVYASEQTPFDVIESQITKPNERD